MGFKCGIIGLPNVGKSTLFNALTESNKAEAANYPFATINPNIGRVAVPDSRLNKLSEISDSKNTIPTYIEFVDIAGLVKGASSGEGLGNKFLSYIREVDAIIHVVRCFEDNTIAIMSSVINPIEDIETILTELKLADIEVLQKKSLNLKSKLKSGEKNNKIQLNLISSLLDKLNNNEPLILKEWKKDQQQFIDKLNLITSKPMLYICNVDEKSIIKGNNLSNLVKEKIKKEGYESVIVSASIESQIAQIDHKYNKLELLQNLKLKETALKKVIHAGYNLLNLLTYFTSGPKETKAWTVPKDTTAIKAAGKIHSDFEKGFIRAETINYKDFITLKGEAACREAGKLRQEGKNYFVQDGDVFNFLFNVSP